MAIDVTIETAIDAPPEVVFAKIADVDGWPSWLIASGIVSVARTGEGSLAAGERLTVTQRAAGRAGVFDAVVEALDPPNRLVVEGRDAEGVTIAIEADVAAADGGSTLRLVDSDRAAVPLPDLRIDGEAPSPACGRARHRGAAAHPGVRLHRLTSVHVDLAAGVAAAGVRSRSPPSRSASRCGPSRSIDRGRRSASRPSAWPLLGPWPPPRTPRHLAPDWSPPTRCRPQPPERLRHPAQSKTGRSPGFAGSWPGARSGHGQLRDRHPRDQRPRAPAGCGHQPPRRRARPPKPPTLGSIHRPSRQVRRGATRSGRRGRGGGRRASPRARASTGCSRRASRRSCRR